MRRERDHRPKPARRRAQRAGADQQREVILQPFPFGVGFSSDAHDLFGEMPEWSIGPHSKCGERATVPGVRIPLSPLSMLIISDLQNLHTKIHTLCGVCIFFLAGSRKGSYACEDYVEEQKNSPG